MKSRLATGLLSFVLCALLLAACSAGSSGQDSGVAGSTSSAGASLGASGVQPERSIWKETRPETDGSFSLSDLKGMFAVGDFVYFWSVASGEDWNHRTLTVARISSDTIGEGALKAEQIYTHEIDGGEVQAVCADEDGAVYAYLRRWEAAEEAFLSDEGDFLPQDASGEKPADSEMPAMSETGEDGETETPRTPAGEGTETTVLEVEEATGVSEDSKEDTLPDMTAFMERPEWNELVAIAPDGSVKYTQRVGTEEGSTYYYGEAGMVCAEDTLILSDAEGVCLYEKEDGSLRANIWKPEQENFYGSMRVSLLADKTPVMYGYTETGEILCEIDVAAGKQGKDRNPPQNGGLWKVSTGISHDFYQENNGVIQGFSLDVNGMTDVVVYSDSDLLIHDVSAVVEISPEMLLVLHNEDAESYQGRYGGFGSYGMDQGQALSILTKTDISTLPERTELTLATTSRTTPITTQVANFNRENETYRIRLVDYSQYNTQTNWQGAKEQLNKDIVAGNIPDMVALDPDMAGGMYFSKGVFEPLDEYLKNDPQITGLLENVYQAGQYDGKNYVVIPSFQVSLVLAKQSLVSDTDTWTPADVTRIVEANNMKWENLFGYTLPREQVLQYVFQIGADSFIDRNARTCDFGSERFADLLEFTMRFPSRQEYESMNTDYDWNRMEAMWRANEALLNIAQIQDFNSYRELRHVTFGEEMEMVGFPLGEKGAGCIIMPEEKIAISAKSGHKDACWEFLRSYLLPSYQENVKHGFPVTEAALEKMADEARKPETWTDEDGVEHEIDNRRTIGDQEIKVPTLSKTDTDEAIAILRSVKNSLSGDTTVLEIIGEETGAFYDGKKTAQEVAAIIQNRVQLYLDEQ